MVAEVLFEEANVSPAEWKELSAEQRQSIITLEFFPSTLSACS